MTEATFNSPVANALRDSFDTMISQLQAARDVIDTPSLYPVPEDDRNLAEGYRYLMGFVLGGIERALDDPMYPRFKRSIQPMNRSTIDNADAVYLYAQIDGEHSYTLRGKAGDTSHWRGEPFAGDESSVPPRSRAPQYVIFELCSGYSGDSGSLKEMRRGERINTSVMDCHSIQVESDGTFEILIAPEKPTGFEGNFMLSKRESHGKEYVGRFLTLREIFHDWEKEDLLDLEIIRHGCENTPRPAITPDTAMEMMGEIGNYTNNHMRFWNAFNAVTLETYGKVPGGVDTGSDKPFMPTNDMNQPNALGIATGGGQSTNVYAGGVYKLDDDEALIIESIVPIKPSFLGFHLSNLWGESLDFESYQSSLNTTQMHVGEDGIYRWVVCHRDPGFLNWLDTSGLAHGYLTVRYTYEEKPPKQDWPTLNVTKVAFDEIASKLPATTLRVDQASRSANTLMRHRHVQRRYRQY